MSGANRTRGAAGQSGLRSIRRWPRRPTSTGSRRRLRRGPGGLPDGVGQRLEVVAARPEVGGVRGQPQDLPAARGGEPLGVRGAQVVAVRLGVGGQRAEDGGGVGVDVGERRDSGAAARGAGAAADRAHGPNGSDRDRRGAALSSRAVRRVRHADDERHRFAVGTDLGCGMTEHPAGSRRRDRRGRGLRGSLLPGDLPAARSRSEQFDELVLDAVEPGVPALGQPAAGRRRAGRGRPAGRRRGRAAVARPSPRPWTSRPGSWSTAGRSSRGRRACRCARTWCTTWWSRRSPTSSACRRRSSTPSATASRRADLAARSQAGRQVGPRPAGTDHGVAAGLDRARWSAAARAGRPRSPPGRRAPGRTRPRASPRARRTAARADRRQVDARPGCRRAPAPRSGSPVAGGSGASRTVASPAGAASSSELVTAAPCRASGTTPGVAGSQRPAGGRVRHLGELARPSRWPGPRRRRSPGRRSPATPRRPPRR